eukprot:1984979-Pyramimonas_sp.AAC.1
MVISLISPNGIKLSVTLVPLRSERGVSGRRERALCERSRLVRSHPVRALFSASIHNSFCRQRYDARDKTNCWLEQQEPTDYPMMALCNLAQASRHQSLTNWTKRTRVPYMHERAKASTYTHTCTQDNVRDLGQWTFKTSTKRLARLHGAPAPASWH